MAIDPPAGTLTPLAAPDQALWNALIARPTIVIPIPSTAASRLLVGGTCILAALALRENAATVGPPTFVTGSATGAAAAITASLPAPGAGITNWITGFQVTGSGATAALVVVVTLTGVITGTLSFVLVVPAGVTASTTPLVVTFPWPGIPASGANTAITVNVPTFGAGNTNVAATIEGYTATAGAQENTGLVGAQAALDLYDGLDTTASLAGSFVIPPSGSIVAIPGPAGALLRTGLYLSVLTGTVKGAVWVKV